MFLLRVAYINNQVRAFKAHFNWTLEYGGGMLYIGNDH
jgi:hypothetical protein